MSSDFLRPQGNRSTPVSTILVWIVAVIGVQPLFNFVKDRFVDPDWLATLFAATVASVYFILLTRYAKRLKNEHEIATVVPERAKIAQSIAHDALDGRKIRHSFVLFLRPFQSDGRRPMADPYSRGRPGLLRGLAKSVLFSLLGAPSTQTDSVDLETIFADMLAPRYQFVSVGGRQDVVGAGRITIDNWRPLVRALMDEARLIVFIPSDTPGCDWEAQEIIGSDALNKTMFIMPPGVEQRVWNDTQQGWEKHGTSLPLREDSGLMFFLNESGNACWLCAFSPREPFSEIRARVINIVDAGGLRQAVDSNASLAKYLIRQSFPNARMG